MAESSKSIDFDGVRLTRIESEILQSLAEGFTAPEIARFRFRSYSVVCWHIKNIHRKLEAKTNAQAVALSYKSGLLRIALVLLLFFSLSPFSVDKGRVRKSTSIIRATQIREHIA